MTSETKAHQNQLYLWQATAALNKCGLGSFQWYLDIQLGVGWNNTENEGKRGNFKAKIESSKTTKIIYQRSYSIGPLYFGSL